MSDFHGMGGAVLVCLIAQSIVFLALAVMAGVIRLVGMLGRESGPAALTVPRAPAAVPVRRAGEEREVAAAIMGALTAELSRGREMKIPGEAQGSTWRLVSLQEASRTTGKR